MSIPVLAQVYDEVRRLAVAGSVVAPGDFRLKKLIPVLEQTGKKSPIFAKVAEGVTKVVESTDKNSGEALLELSTLINAILYTQGETGIEGELAAIETKDLGLQSTQASARMLKPLVEALTTTGSGRLEVIQEAFERGMFRDLRLVGPALAALDDPYPDIAEFVLTNVLPQYGNSILPELRASFDAGGRGGHVRRLLLLHQLDPEGSRATIMEALENGSKEVKVAAISCLGSNPDDVSILLEQVKSKAKDVRKAALVGLSRSDHGDAVQALRSAFSGSEMEMVVGPIQRSRNAEVLNFVLGAAKGEWNAFINGKEKDKSKLGKQTARLLSTLECLRGRDDRETEAFLLSAFAQSDRLASIKGDPSGEDVAQKLVSLMLDGTKKLQRALVDAHPTLPPEMLKDAFWAACRCCKPAEVFDLFSGYITVKVDGKKKNPAVEKKHAIMDVLIDGKSGLYTGVSIESLDIDGRRMTDILDRRWLDLALKLKDLDMVQALAIPDHAGAIAFLKAAFRQHQKGRSDEADTHATLWAMVRMHHPDATEALVSLLEKCAKANHLSGLSRIARFIPYLPHAAVERLESLLPGLSERAADILIEPIETLKQQARAPK